METLEKSSFILTNDEETAQKLTQAGLIEFFPFKKESHKTHYFVNEPKKVKPLLSQFASGLKMGFTSRLSA